MKSRRALLLASPRLPILIVAALTFFLTARYALGPDFSFQHAALCVMHPFTPAPARVRPGSTPVFSAARADAADCAYLNGTEAAVFFHAWPNNAWRAVADDVVATLQASPLAACGVPTFVGFPAAATWPFDGVDPLIRRATLPAAAASRPHNEPVTLAALAEWCAEAPATRVAIYIHDKGVRDSPSDVTRFLREWDWRKLHEYFLLERPQGCFRALLGGNADACGVNRVEQSESGGYYSGNFWMARCDFIVALPPPLDYIYKPNPHVSPELWIGMLPTAVVSARGRPARLFNCFDSAIDHYASEFSRAIYVGENCGVDVSAVKHGG
jgi:hypothetical protein